MKQLKEYLTEGNFFGNLGIGKEGKRQLIEEWLKKYASGFYRINNDLSISGKSIQLKNYSEKEIPNYIQFDNVGTFIIEGADNLETLKGCPKECKYFCCICVNLKSLEGMPVCNDFKIWESYLTSLKGAPKECEEFKINCWGLKDLKGAPNDCKKFCCVECEDLISLEGAPKNCNIFCCYGCNGKFTEEDVRKVCNAKKIIFNYIA